MKEGTQQIQAAQRCAEAFAEVAAGLGAARSDASKTPEAARERGERKEKGLQNG